MTNPTANTTYTCSVEENGDQGPKVYIYIINKNFIYVHWFLKKNIVSSDSRGFARESNHCQLSHWCLDSHSQISQRDKK